MKPELPAEAAELLEAAESFLWALTKDESGPELEPPPFRAWAAALTRLVAATRALRARVDE